MKILSKMIPLLMGDKPVKRNMINKLVFLADAVHFLEQGATISGVTYYKLTHGPAPKAMTDLRQRLVASGLLSESMTTDGLINKFTYSVKDTANVAVLRKSFTGTSLDVMDRVRVHLGDKTASDLSSAIHAFEPWKSHLIGDGLDMARLRQDPAFPEWLRKQGV